MKFILQPKSPDTACKVVVYEYGGLAGNSQELPIGRYSVDQLTIKQIGSMHLLDGVAVKLYSAPDFQGPYQLVTSPVYPLTPVTNPSQPLHVSCFVIELAAEIYEHKDYTGDYQTLAIGSYDKDQLGAVGENELSSLRVPPGLAVTLFEHSGFSGEIRTYIQDCDDVKDFENKTSSIIVALAEIEIPDTSLKYGDKISILAGNGKFLSAKPEKCLLADSDKIGDNEKFILVRSSDSKNNIFVSFGDTITLQSYSYNTYIKAESNDIVSVNGQTLEDSMKFTLFRSGDTQNRSFFCDGDMISLLANNRNFLSVKNYNIYADNNKVDDPLDKLIIVTTPGDNIKATTENLPSLVCGADVCGAAVCGAAASGASACGAAACGAAVCGAAACGAAAYGIVVCGQAACGCDACGGAVCAVDECGGQGCGGAACGGAVCGGAVCAVATCGADVCGGYAGGIAACPIDACGANVCGINACPCDACAADACAIDVIPILPGI